MRIEKLVLILVIIICLLDFNSFAFFVGFGGAGGMDQTIKEGQKNGVIPVIITPGNLRATKVFGHRIDLSWQDSSNDE